MYGLSSKFERVIKMDKKLTRDIVENILSLSNTQEGLLFHYLSNQSSEEYFEQLSLNITGKININIFMSAWNLVVETNEMLRTVFKWKNIKKPLQIVLRKLDIPIKTIDFSSIGNESEKQKLLLELKEDDRKEKFNLETGPLIRILLCKLKENNYEMIISNHHIIYDGWSTGIILKEFFDAYFELSQGRKPKTISKNKFDKFIKWTQQLDKSAQEEYWRTYLHGFDTKTILPADLKDESNKNKVNKYTYEFPQNLMKLLKNTLLSYEITMGSFFYTIWGVMLQKYNNIDDAVFGTTVSGRPAVIDEIENMVGLFINTLPLRVKAQSDYKFLDLLKIMKKIIQDRQRYENTPLVDIQSYSEIANQNTLFNSIVVIENYPLDERLNIEDRDLKINSFSTTEHTNYDLILEITTFDKIKMNVIYNQSIFKPEIINRLAAHMGKIITEVLQNMEITLREIEVISEKEKQKILYEFNNTTVTYPIEKTISQLFAEQVSETPNNIALVYGDKQLTYSELYKKVNHLAYILREKGVGRDKVVGIMAERSLELIVGVLAIVQAGAAYLPIDLEYPKSRIEYMLKDSSAKLLLLQKGIETRVKFTEEIVYLDENDDSSEECTFIENINQPNDLIYIMYTSGSTGQPKGVMIEHRNVNRLISNSNMLIINSDDKILQTGSFAFDASTFEIWGVLLNGACLYLISKDKLLSPDRLAEKMEEYQITMMWLTAPLFNHLLDENILIFSKLNTLLVGGDALSPSHINLLRNKYPELKIINGYGPTESTTFATYFKIEDDYPINIPIGKPVSNTQVYIIDKDNNLQPIGFPGELCISGDGLARGYLNNPILTQEKFVQSPLTGNKMYKTGDLARWLADGNIEFLGRIDQQVKIRGFRIETGAIETKLLSYDGVKQVVVVDKIDSRGEKYLCAYFVSDGEISDLELRSYLEKELPRYMIPSYFKKLNKLPLTSNGKIDRSKLPEVSDCEFRTEYIAPRNEIEKKLAKIWSDIFDIEKIGIQDNFFDLGGHSLKATRLVSMISKELDVEVSIKEIFENQTIEQLAGVIIQAEKSTYLEIKKIEEQDYYPLSSAQKRMYILNQFDITSTNYNITCVINIEGELDIQRFELAFNKLIERNESFRTSFELVNGQPVQKIHQSIDFEIIQIDDRENKIDEIILEFVKPYDLTKAPLLRVGLVDCGNNIYKMILDMHHIISDGVSMNILAKDFISLYEGKELTNLRVQYKDFTVWQNQFFQSNLIKKQEKFWTNMFADEIPVLNMSYDYLRPPVLRFAADRVTFDLNRELSSKLNLLASQQGGTLYMLLLASYNILLSKYTGQEDIIIGSPIAGRRHVDLEPIIGMFVNTLAMRNYPVGEKTFVDFLEEVKNNTLQAFENQDYQFEELVEKLELGRDLGRNPLFDTMFVLQNEGSAELVTSNLKMSVEDFFNEVTKFDMTLTVIETSEGIRFDIHYMINLFKKTTMENFARHFKNILYQIVNNSESTLSEMEMLSEDEKEMVLYKFNDTKAAYPAEQTIIQLFESQVSKTPEAVALFFKGEQLSYQQLNEKSNRLARTLRKKGVQVDDIVGIISEQSLDLLVGILGILKAGAAYLPIDSEYPLHRMEYMIKDSNIDLLLIQNYLPDIDFQGEFLNLNNQKHYANDCSNLDNLNSQKDIVYVIYTSGSTGKPKGVMVEQRGLVNYITWASKIYVKGEKINFPLYSSLSFDLTVTSIFVPLITGNQIIAYEKDEKDLLIRRIIKDNRVQIIKLTPTHLQIIRDLDLTNSNIKRIIVGGEELKVRLAKEIYYKFNEKIEIFNEYGPTETVVGCMIHKFDVEKDNEISVPIGVPADNVQIYFLDQYQKPVAVGVPGEIYISGDGVVRGYLNQAELTEEKFIKNQFIPGKRMYRTGDLAIRKEDGNLVFLGRIDHQVKIRGHRIELGEIEQKLLTFESIKAAVVIDRKNSNDEKYLCAYFTSDVELPVSDLRNYLGKELPEYMIPSYFIRLDELPLTSNGKINRHGLPEPSKEIYTGREYLAPTNEIEEKLVNIWSEILGIKKIGVSDSFFELGGHSLKAMQLISKVFAEMNVELPLQKIFKTPTIRELSEYILGAEKKEYYKIEKVEEREYYPVSSAQKRMFIINQLEMDSIAYNMLVTMIIEGKLDQNRFENAFKILVERHESLRTSFDYKNGEVVQQIHQDIDFKMDKIDADENEIEKLISEFVRPFNLKEAPLLRVRLISFSSNKYLLLFDTHHIVSDGVSMNLLINEFVTLYQEEKLTDLRIQYKDFTIWQNKLFQSGSEFIQKQEEYWLETFKDEITVLQLPLDFSRSALRTFEVDTYSFELNRKLKEQLRVLAVEKGMTLYMVILAIYKLLLHKYTSQEDIVVGSTIAGRPHQDLEKIVGMFVNTLGIRSHPQANKKFSEFLVDVKENVLKSFENQDYPFEMLIEKLNLHRIPNRNPLFDILLNWQDSDLLETEIQGLKLIPYSWNKKISKFDLILHATETSKGVKFSLEYRAELFKRSTIERLVSHFLNLIGKVLENQEAEIFTIEMISEKEKQQLLFDFNPSTVPYPHNKVIQELFIEQVERTPNNIAAFFEGKQLTYLELSKKANQLARTLRERGVAREQVVGIFAERSLEMLIGVLAIVQAGGAYLPLDPDYPVSRIEYMVKDSAVRLVLTQKGLKTDVSFIEEIIYLDDVESYSDDSSHLETINQPSDLIYIIYTSGSTGQPKGVMVEHRNVNRLISNSNMLIIKEGDHILQTGSLAFDASTFEIWGSLLNGACLYLMNKNDLLSTARFGEKLKAYQITMIWLTAPLFNQLVDGDYTIFSELKTLIVGGYALSPRHINLVKQKYPELIILNGYGPTENTTFTTYLRIDKEYINNIPIGIPVSNTQVYVMDKHYNLQPIGVSGELTITGDGLARGYLNRPELTAEKFITNPHTRERMYKTGDLVRWLPDGKIEFLGRVDNQVKIRGFRIEINEIEEHLLSHEKIREAIFVVRKDDNDIKYLVAYIISDFELSIFEIQKLSFTRVT